MSPLDDPHDWLARSHAFREVSDQDDVGSMCRPCLSTWVELVHGPPVGEDAVRETRRRQKSCPNCLSKTVMDS